MLQQMLRRNHGEEQRVVADLETSEAFDNIARSAGSVVSRRESIVLALKGIAALALWSAGVRKARAQVANCLCGGMLYDPVSQCCVSGSIVPKNPIANLAQCPTPTSHPGHVCKPNGCGSDYSHYVVPNSYFGAPFKPCCDTHDCCYDTCNSSQASCDLALQSCLVASCDATFSTTGAIQKRLRSSCESVAGVYFDAVHKFGGSAWTAAQQQSCDCCGTSTCPQACQGNACFSLGRCADNCFCFESTETSGACCPSTPCAGIQTCTTSADCPQGSACTPNTCCGPQGVCQVLCTFVTPAPPTVAAVSPKLRKAAASSPVLTTAGYQ